MKDWYQDNRDIAIQKTKEYAKQHRETILHKQKNTVKTTKNTNNTKIKNGL